MALTIDKYNEEDLPALVDIWNEVVEDGVAFPQKDTLTLESGKEFFGRQDFVAAAKLDGEVVGLYILHPNNVGRCGHQCNSSYAVSSKMRGKKIGEQLVLHSLATGKKLGYRLLIFNAVVKGNDSAIHLYEKLGFHKIGEVPGGFQLKSGEYQNTFMFYHEL